MHAALQRRGVGNSASWQPAERIMTKTSSGCANDILDPIIPFLSVVLWLCFGFSKTKTFTGGRSESPAVSTHRRRSASCRATSSPWHCRSAWSGCARCRGTTPGCRSSEPCRTSQLTHFSAPCLDWWWLSTPALHVYIAFCPHQSSMSRLVVVPHQSSMSRLVVVVHTSTSCLHSLLSTPVLHVKTGGGSTPVLHVYRVVYPHQSSMSNWWWVQTSPPCLTGGGSRPVLYVHPLVGPRYYRRRGPGHQNNTRHHTTTTITLWKGAENLYPIRYTYIHQSTLTV